MPLTIKPPQRPSTSAHSQPDSDSPPTSGAARGGEREQSPEAPPASPLTPVLKAAKLPTDRSTTSVAPQQSSSLPPQTTSRQDGGPSNLPAPHLIDRPAPLPFSGEDSMDAIALRAAISSLQFQRVKAQNDLRTLEEIRKQAVQRPEEFRQYLIDTEFKQKTAGRNTGAKWVPPPDNDDDSDSNSGDDAGAGATRNEENSPAGRKLKYFNAQEVPDSQQASFSSTIKSTSSQGQKPQSVGFPAIPATQNIVRCPPIEWAKYHISGDSLDKLHVEHQARPGVGGYQGPESVVAAPYSPFVDLLEGQSTQRSGVRKDSGASAAEQPAQRRRSSKAFLAAR